MRFSVAAAATALVGSAIAADHLVVVGNGSLTFEPNNVQAAEGDTVTFKFWPSNHSVAQSTFANPCEPMSNGFWSGYIPSTKGAAMETFMVEVTNASAPIWFYCTQGKHCTSGMAGAINAPSSGNTADAFIEKAKQADTIATPASSAGTGGMLMNGTMSSTASGSASTASSTGAASSVNVNGGVVFTGMMGMFAYLLL